MTTQKQIVAVMRALGKRGGKARSLKLTPERRSEIARAAVNARWLKYRTAKSQ